MKIELGKKYKDNLHGFEGVAVARAEYLHGCNRVLIEKMKDDGTIVNEWFDEPQIVGCEKNTAKPGGGPNPPSIR